MAEWMTDGLCGTNITGDSGSIGQCGIPKGGTGQINEAFGKEICDLWAMTLPLKRAILGWEYAQKKPIIGTGS